MQILVLVDNLRYRHVLYDIYIYVDLCISCVSVWTSIIIHQNSSLVLRPLEKNGSGIIRNPHVMTSRKVHMNDQRLS